MTNLRVAVMAVVVAAMVVMVSLLFQPSQGPEAVAAPVAVAPPATPARIVFPVDRQPVMDLPGGERRAVASVLNVTRPMRYGQYVWNTAAIAPDDTWVRIDLAKQIVSVFRGGHEIGTAVILFGADEKPTPLGRFPIIEKREEHRSNLYNADMPFMLRLTYDGVAIHASDVRRNAATHGCIGVPMDFARLLFAEVGVGDPVMILPDAA